jgi:hypothetical protein
MDARDKYVCESQDAAFGFSLDVFQLDVASLNLEFKKVSGNRSMLSACSAYLS